MRQSLHKRLGQLEKRCAAAREARREASVESPVEWIRELLRANDFPQEPKESLAGTFARFLGISSRELDARLMERAHGHAPSPAARGF
jgi:hypothetical protein